MNQLEKNNTLFSRSNNKLQTGHVEIKAYPNINNKISFYATADKMIIDWGDGSIEMAALNGFNRYIVHEYFNQYLQTIKVNTKEMTQFGNKNNSKDITFQKLRFYNCSKFTNLECYSNQLLSLDISGCSDLVKINCWDNQLSYLDVSKCTALKQLACGRNSLTSLDVSKCSKLIRLNCDENALIALDVSKCMVLISLNCNNNQLSTSALNSLFKSLPKRNPDDEAVITCYNNSGFETCDKTIATRKGWRVN